MSKSVLVFAVTGFEPVELVQPVDFLRRAGAKVTVAAVGSKSKIVKGDQGVTIEADALLSDVKGKMFDMVYAPGGIPGADNLAKDKDVVEIIRKHHEAKRWVTSICASPGAVLAACDILKGRKACGYPGMDDGISKAGGIKTETKTTVDGNIITSRGPGTAGLLAFEQIKALFGEETMRAVLQGTISA